MQGAIGPTGLAGMFGPQGVGFRGPTGRTGPTGIDRPGYTTVTGPSGPAGPAGPETIVPGSIYTLSTYATGATGLAVPGNNPTPLTIWSGAIPSQAKGKSGILSTYFDFRVNYPIATADFDYGLYIDDVPLGFGPTKMNRYSQTIASINIVGSNGTSVGVNGPTVLEPITLPVTITANATNLQLKLANVTSLMEAITLGNPTVVTTTGSNTYTIPVGAIGVMAYVWGCGGSPYGSNAGGPGGFSSGFYPASAGTVLTTIVGALGNNTFNFGFGGSGFTGTGTPGSGGGFSGLFLGTSPVSNSSTPLLIAGGGGGCYVNNTGSNFMWSGGGGGGLLGGNTFNIFTRTSTYDDRGRGGSQSGGSYGSAQWNGYNYNSNGAGGGGWYGGGGGDNRGWGGGGGSGFIGTGVKYSYMPLAITSLTTISTGGGSNITAPGSNFMSNLGYSPNTYAHGAGGTGLIVLFPVTSSNTPFVGVDARFTSA